MDANTSSTIDPEGMYNYMNNIFMNPTALTLLVVVVFFYLIFFVVLGNSSNTNTNNYGSNSYSSTSTNTSSGLDGFTNIMIAIVVFVLIMLVLFNVLSYFFSIDVMASIKKLFTSEKQLDIVVNQNGPTLYDGSFNDRPFNDLSFNIIKPIEIDQQQVFNIPGNHYTYDDAKTLCKAYNARLATYDEVEDSYNKGGEWCNYGWSDGQMTLFPTQKTTFDDLQKIPGHEHDCGRPGVNGGYIANPNVKYGVNCYGYKPKITNEEEEMMQNTTPYPKTQKDIELEKRVDFWKTKVDKILVSPFNYTTWSKI
jgi:preprotein translocase subunit SecG